MRKKTPWKYDHLLLSKSHSEGNEIFQTFWCYRLIFDQSLTIHHEIFGQWVIEDYKQRGVAQYCRGDDPMMTWSLLVWWIKWQGDPGVWDDGTKVISCDRAVIIKQSSEGLHRGSISESLKNLSMDGYWMICKYFNRVQEVIQKPNPPTFQSHPTPPGWGGWWSTQHLCSPSSPSLPQRWKHKNPMTNPNVGTLQWLVKMKDIAKIVASS